MRTIVTKQNGIQCWSLNTGVTQDWWGPIKRLPTVRSWVLPDSRTISSAEHSKNPATPKDRVNVQTPTPFLSVLMGPKAVTQLASGFRLSLLRM